MRFSWKAKVVAGAGILRDSRLDFLQAGHTVLGPVDERSELQAARARTQRQWLQAARGPSI